MVLHGKPGYGGKGSNDEEEEIIPIAVPNPLGDFDFVVESLELAGVIGKEACEIKPSMHLSFNLAERTREGMPRSFAAVNQAFPCLFTATSLRLLCSFFYPFA